MYKVANIFHKSIELETASEKDAVDAASGRPWIIVIDTEKRRIYDGEDERWYSFKLYLTVTPLLKTFVESHCK